MRIKTNWAYIVCVFVFVLLLVFGIYFILSLHGYTSENITSFSADCDLSNIINNIISYIGIQLGFFYFIFRFTIENNKEKSVIKHNTYQYIDVVIEQCHEIMEDLFHKNVKAKDIKRTIDNLNSKSILIQNYIEINENRLDEKFYNATSAYATWNSFITTCNVVNIAQDQYNTTDFMAERDQYLEYFRLLKCSIYSFM